MADEPTVKLYLGDCLDILPTLGKVDAVVTDPPYGLSFPYHSYVDSRFNLIRLIRLVMPLLHEMADNVFVLCGPSQITLYPEPDWVAAITWNTTGSFGKYGYSQWTPLLCYGSDLDGFGNVNNVMKTDTLTINGGAGVGFQRTKDEKEHSCPKPLNMMQMIANRFTLPGCTVLDPFMGSGTTGVACVRTGRRFIGIEIDEDYFKIAQKRIAEAQAQLPLFPPSNNGLHLTAAPGGLWNNVDDSGAAAGEP